MPIVAVVIVVRDWRRSLMGLMIYEGIGMIIVSGKGIDVDVFG